MLVRFQKYLNISPKIFEEYSNITFYGILPNGIRVVPLRKTDMMEQIILETPENCD